MKETLPIIELRPVPWAGCPPQPTHGLGRLRGRSARLCAVPRPHRSEYHTTCPFCWGGAGTFEPPALTAASSPASHPSEPHVLHGAARSPFCQSVCCRGLPQPRHSTLCYVVLNLIRFPWAHFLSQVPPDAIIPSTQLSAIKPLRVRPIPPSLSRIRMLGEGHYRRTPAGLCSSLPSTHRPTDHNLRLRPSNRFFITKYSSHQIHLSSV